MQTAATSDGLTVHIKGYETLLQGLRRFAPEAERELRTVIKEQANVVKEAARANAMSIRDTGAYAASFGVRDVQKGTKVYSTDPGAGTMEFANRGAVYLSGPRAGRPIGVPRGGKPRALVPAVLDNEQQTLTVVENALVRLCDEVRGV